MLLNSILSLEDACEILLKDMLSDVPYTDIFVSGFIRSEDAEHSHICFDISDRSSSVCLFCVYEALSYDSNRLDPDNWNFFIVDSSELPRLDILSYTSLTCLFNRSSGYFCVHEDLKNCWRTYAGY